MKVLADWQINENFQLKRKYRDMLPSKLEYIPAYDERGNWRDEAFAQVAADVDAGNAVLTFDNYSANTLLALTTSQNAQLIFHITPFGGIKSLARTKEDSKELIAQLKAQQAFDRGDRPVYDPKMKNGYHRS